MIEIPEKVMFPVLVLDYLKENFESQFNSEFFLSILKAAGNHSSAVHTACFTDTFENEVQVTRAVMDIHIVGMWRWILLHLLLYSSYISSQIIWQIQLHLITELIWHYDQREIMFEFGNHQELWTAGEYDFLFCSFTCQCIVRERKLTVLMF